MKSNQTTLISLMAMSLFATACGEYSKSPVTDIQSMRENAQLEISRGPEKPRVINNDIIVEKPVVVVREESSIDGKFIVITPDAKMTFNEGQKAQFSIRARVLIPGIDIKLTAQGLPDGAVLERSTKESDLYTLTWTPSLYLIPANEAMKVFTSKISAEVSGASNPAEAEKLKGLTRSQEISIFLFRNQEAPSALAVTGLSNEVTEGSLVPFTVTVKVPGTDAKVPQKPRLVVSYDGVSFTAGNSFLELDGARYIVADLNKKDAEYIGDSNWKFTMLFDTKNISVQPQLSKDGTVMASADGTRVRLSFKVYSPYGLATSESLKQIKVRYNKPISAPRFEVLALGQQSLEVSAGQKVDLKFTVLSGDAQAVIKVESAKSNLPGNPQVTCADSSTAGVQSCSLTWDIPCDIKVSALSGDVTVTAIAVVNGRNSEATTYKLKVQASADDKKLCATAEAK